jgi:hypothetical protein
MPNLKPKSPRTLFRAFLGAFAVLVALEGALRVPALVRSLRAGPHPLAAGDAVLVLGDAYAGATLGALARALERKAPGRAPKVEGASGESLNSAEALEREPALLERLRPAALVLLVGEANFWNRRYLGRFLRDRPGVRGFFSDLRLVRALRPGETDDPPVPAGTPLSPGDFLAWARHDLVRLVRGARERGVVPVLQTYPPQRYSGRDPAVNLVIRSVASDLHVPLSDTASELRRRWNGRALEEFYGQPPNDRLNERGNELVAEILVGDLERIGLLRPNPDRR